MKSIKFLELQPDNRLVIKTDSGTMELRVNEIVLGGRTSLNNHLKVVIVRMASRHHPLWIGRLATAKFVQLPWQTTRPEDEVRPHGGDTQIAPQSWLQIDQRSQSYFRVKSVKLKRG